jgi:hypothetical protein
MLIKVNGNQVLCIIVLTCRFISLCLGMSMGFSKSLYEKRGGSFYWFVLQALLYAQVPAAEAGSSLQAVLRKGDRCAKQGVDALLLRWCKKGWTVTKQPKKPS